MKRGRAYREARELGKRYPTSYNEADRRVIIDRYDYPEGWTPRFGKLRYELPSTYPRDIPVPYIPRDMEYEKSNPTHRLTYSNAPGDDGSEWDKWCIEDHNVSWDPDTDSLVKFTTMMRASLGNPDSNNPFIEVA